MTDGGIFIVEWPIRQAFLRDGVRHTSTHPNHAANHVQISTRLTFRRLPCPKVQMEPRAGWIEAAKGGVVFLQPGGASVGAEIFYAPLEGTELRKLGKVAGIGRDHCYSLAASAHCNERIVG